MNHDLLEACLRDRLESNRNRFRSDLQREEEREELIKLSGKLSNIKYVSKAFHEEFKKDAEFKPEE